MVVTSENVLPLLVLLLLLLLCTMLILTVYVTVGLNYEELHFVSLKQSSHRQTPTCVQSATQ
jgi:hypothetical protein